MPATHRKIRRLVPTENQEQRALVYWIRLQPKLCDYLIKINNEGKRTHAQGWHLKMMGMCPGASDLFLAVPSNGLHGLWLEIKRNMVYTPSQRRSESWLAEEAFIERVKSVGFGGEFCYGFESGKRIIESYLS